LNQVASSSARSLPKLRVGDVVEVLSPAEILATLDEKGEFENLQFMPEMLQFCGQRMTVHKVAHKLCEITSGRGGMHWMNNAVHLTGARCSGQAHGGCQTACLLYWKEAWLRPVPQEEAQAAPPRAPSATSVDTSILDKATRKEPDLDGTERFACQATEILRAAPSQLRFWDVEQYVADLKSGNAGVFAVLRSLMFRLFNIYQGLSRRFLPRWLWIRDGLAWGFVKGRAVGRTPTAHLDLEVGEFVRIKSKDEIAATLDSRNLNRGMGFEEEMARYCGKTARVLRRVDRCIDEKTGKLLTMKNPCIVLDGVACAGVYHANCPKGYLPFWREVWLERMNAVGSRSRDRDQQE